MHWRIQKAFLKRSPVLWANMGKVSQILAHAFSTVSPPILILSIPRSGSSWVGKILGLSSTSLYLREPITQTYLSHEKVNALSVFEVTHRNLPSTYRASSAAAFIGLPIFRNISWAS